MRYFIWSIFALFSPSILLAGNVIFLQDSGGGGGGPQVAVDSYTYAAQSSNTSSHPVVTDGTGGVPVLNVDEGDLIVGVWCVDGTGGSPDLTCPSGWHEEFDILYSGNSVQGALCTKVADATDASATSFELTSSSSQESQAGMWTFINYTGNADTAIVCTNSEQDTDSPVSTTITPASGALTIRGFCSDGGRISTNDAVFAAECETGNRWSRESSDAASGPASGGGCIDGIDASGTATWTSVLAQAEETIEWSCAISD